MRKINFRFIFLFVLLFFNLFTSRLKSEVQLPDSTKTNIVYRFDILEEIGPSIWRKLQKAFDEAASIKAEYILIRMNTYGGMLDAADSIRTKILNCPVPVIVFIDNNAASAGALISIACDKIYMRKGSSIGAATVVDGSGQRLPDKYQSYMRSMMRATAESHGKDTTISGGDTLIRWYRDPLIAEAMVDPRIAIPGIADTGKVLTFSPSEAIKYGYCEGMAENINEVLHLTGIEKYEMKEFKAGTMDHIIGFLVNPVISGLLIMIIIAGIYFEMQSPGIGFPLIAAIIAAVLYFAPLYLEGLAEHWEILLFIGGVALLALELFVIPGFGVAGISGIVLIVVGLTLSLIDNIVFDLDSNYRFGYEAVMKSFFIVVVSILLSFFFSLYLSKRLFTASAGPFKNFALNKSQLIEEGYIAVDEKLHALVGKNGIAYTILRPSGKVEIEGNVYDAMADLGYIERGENILVVKYETGQLYVRKTNVS